MGGLSMGVSWRNGPALRRCFEATCKENAMCVWGRLLGSLERLWKKGVIFSFLFLFLIHAIVISHILIHLFIAVFAAGLKLLGLPIIFSLEDRCPLHHTRWDWHWAVFLQWHSGWPMGTSALPIFRLQVSMALLSLALVSAAELDSKLNSATPRDLCA